MKQNKKKDFKKVAQNDLVRAKKHLGQHFLKDEHIAENITLALKPTGKKVLEIGPGMGVLTKYLLPNEAFETSVVEIDKESVEYLKKHYSSLENRIFDADFLQMNLEDFSKEPFSIIGNFPYNISSQIFFKVIDNRNLVDEVVCMLQKEVAKRIASPAGNKDYGILSVLLQAYYNIDYCFTVYPGAFNPPPKVDSGVIRLKRNSVEKLACDEKTFKNVVKTGFNQRRKTLRNALKPLGIKFDDPLLDKRAEQLSVADFIYLTNRVEQERLIIEN